MVEPGGEVCAIQFCRAAAHANFAPDLNTDADVNRASLSTESLPSNLNPSTLQIQSRIAIPDAVVSASLTGDAEHHLLYASTLSGIAVIDTTTLRILRTLPIKTSLSEIIIAHSPTHPLLVSVGEWYSDSHFLVAYDPHSAIERGRVEIGAPELAQLALSLVSRPVGAAINTDGSRLYIGEGSTGAVRVIDPRALVTIAPTQLCGTRSAERMPNITARQVRG